MGLFDSLSNALGNAAKTAATGAVTNAAGAAKRGISRSIHSAATTAGNQAVQAMGTKKKTFTFDKIPTNLEELKAIPGADLKDPMATAALTMITLCNFVANREATIEMFDYLMGPGALSNLELQRLDEGITKDRHYLPFSYFEGATVANNYTPNVPYKIEVKETPSSKNDESQGYLRIFMHSAGADNDRYLSLRNKPSTGEWFLSDVVGVLPSIRVPANENPWL